MSGLHLKLLVAMSYGSSTVDRLARRVSRSFSAVQNDLVDLRKRGLVEASNCDRIYWDLTKPGYEALDASGRDYYGRKK